VAADTAEITASSVMALPLRIPGAVSSRQTGSPYYQLAGTWRIPLAAMCGAGPAAMLELTARVPAAGGTGRRRKGDSYGRGEWQ
jgi:hypothetical protein